MTRWRGRCSSLGSYGILPIRMVILTVLGMSVDWVGILFREIILWFPRLVYGN